jgi:hypothetical protein
MKPSHDALEQDVCPVGDEMLGTLYRSSEHGLAALIESVPPSTRAMLALFCYRRSHLQDLAMTIASSCTERDLVNWGAALGSVLFAKSRQLRPSVSPAASGRGKITLATQKLTTFAPIDVDVDDEPAASLTA